MLITFCYSLSSTLFFPFGVGTWRNIDPAFIQPIQHRPTPVISITQPHGIPLSSTHHHCKCSPLITPIREACTNWGFFQVTNHGVPLNTLHNLNHAALNFFSLPDDQKRQVWSNDKYESVEHRVVVHSDKERISIPFFFNPAHYVMIKPLEEVVDDQNPAKYREYNYGAFFASKRKSNLNKLNVDNLQISHFKITE